VGTWAFGGPRGGLLDRHPQLVGPSVRSHPGVPNAAVLLGDQGGELDDVVWQKLSDQAVVGEDLAVVGIAAVDGADQDELAVSPGGGSR
jgi:hypothetical protein